MTKYSDYPKHVQTLFDNLDEVTQLLNIHKKIAGTTPGRKSNVQTLNKSAIVLLTACWESFIEDLASDSFDFLLSKCPDHSKIPKNILKKVAEELKTHKHELKIWELCGNGWQLILKEYKNQILTTKIDFFHVPRPENIDELFKKLLDLNHISKHWKWKNMSNSDAKQVLNNFINTRGDIAHRVKTSKNVQKKDVQYYLEFMNRLGILCHNSVNQHLKSTTGEAPWDEYHFGLTED